MSTPRFKKDKEIIAEYESQVKGEGESLQMCFSRNIRSCGQSNVVVLHNLVEFIKKLANRDPRCGLQQGKQTHLCIAFQYKYTLDLRNYLQINCCYILLMWVFGLFNPHRKMIPGVV